MDENETDQTADNSYSENLAPQDSADNELFENHYFNVAIARLCGLEAAVIFNHIFHWIKFNKKNRNNFHEGTTWFYETIENLSKHLSYLTEKQIRYAIQKLLAEKILIKSNFNKNKFDHTPWYALSDKLSKNLFEAPNLARRSANSGASIYNDSDIETDIESSSAPPNVGSKDFSFSSEAQEAAEYLLATIRKHNPGHKAPNMKIWLRDMDRLIRIDKRSPKEIKEIIDWLGTDLFWLGNVKDPGKLREKFDQLKLKSKFANSTKKSSQLENHEHAKKFFKSGEIYSGYECNISSQAISFTSLQGQSHMQLAFKENGFLDQFENMCRKLKIKLKEDS